MDQLNSALILHDPEESWTWENAGSFKTYEACREAHTGSTRGGTSLPFQGDRKLVV